MLPEKFLLNIKAQLGSEYDSFLRAMELEPAQALRLNPLRQNALDACAGLLGDKVEWDDMGYYFANGAKPGATLLHAAGAFYIQDASAMAAVNALKPQKGEVILDMCAAPGGKSCQIASMIGSEGALLSNEYVKSRASILCSNLERMGYGGAMVTNSTVRELCKLGEIFDACLVDAPCSGEGMFRKDVDARSEWSESAPEKCSERQLEILDAAAHLLKRGGRMVYSTCTFNEIENEGTVSRFLKEHTELEPMEFSLAGVGASTNGSIRLWPHKIRGEGHFVCLMQKKGEADKIIEHKFKPDKIANEAAKEIERLCLNYSSEGIMQMRGNALYCLNPKLIDPKGINVMNAGLKLAELNGSTLIPAHALAMSLMPEQAKSVTALNTEAAIKYMQGEALEAEGKNGWTLVCYKNMPLGWGKISGGILKNHLPKGLRLRGGHALKA